MLANNKQQTTNDKQLMAKTLVDRIVDRSGEVTNFSAIWTQRAIEQNGN